MKIVTHLYKERVDSSVFTQYMVVVDPSSEESMFGSVTACDTVRYKNPSPTQQESSDSWFRRFNKELLQLNQQVKFVILENLHALQAFLLSRPPFIQAVFVKKPEEIILFEGIEENTVKILSKSFAKVSLCGRISLAALNSINDQCTVIIRPMLWSNLTAEERNLLCIILKRFIITYFGDFGEDNYLALSLTNDILPHLVERIKKIDKLANRLTIKENLYTQFKQHVPSHIKVVYTFTENDIDNCIIMANGLEPSVLSTMIPTNITSIKLSSMPTDITILNALPAHVIEVHLPEKPSSLFGLRAGLQVCGFLQPVSQEGSSTREETPIDLLLNFQRQTHKAAETAATAEEKRPKIEEEEINPIVPGSESDPETHQAANAQHHLGSPATNRM